MTREGLFEALGGVADRHVAAAVRFDPRGAYALPERSADMNKRRTIRRVAVTALAAALLLALGATAWAALDGAEWFKSWFASASGTELTEGQTEYIDQAAAGVGQSVTADGWTVTLQSAMTDGQYLYMMLDAQAPEGLGQFFPLVDGTLVSADPNAPDDLFSGRGCCSLEGGLNGEYSFLLEKSIPTELLAQGLDWSCPLTLTLNELTDGRTGHENELLSEGPWTFQFTVTPPEQEQVELVTEPFDAKGTIMYQYYKGVPLDQAELEPGTMLDAHTGLTTKTEEVDIQVTSLKLSSMGAVCTYGFQPREKQTTVDPWDLVVSFAGGKAEISGCSNYWPEEDVCVLSIEFGAPIDLDEVTAVSFQGHELELPEK